MIVNIQAVRKTYTKRADKHTGEQELTGKIQKGKYTRTIRSNDVTLVIIDMYGHVSCHGGYSWYKLTYWYNIHGISLVWTNKIIFKASRYKGMKTKLMGVIYWKGLESNMDMATLIYITKQNSNYYLVAWEQDPTQSCRKSLLWWIFYFYIFVFVFVIHTQDNSLTFFKM